MAQVRISSAALCVFFAAGLLLLGVVRAQDNELAPSPSIEAGAGSLVTVSSVLVCSSLLFSVLALLRH
ncbi:Uncharacterized protein TCM_040599 [Theobroma cacao]|uniref:Uncharacterized protein n=1 Tax=Theobroma cacao TaxID=3641 RepID=A0A061GSW2_THECC|nr:Uncharacterized protein TCM_040599 [Theobroma cacao]